MTSQQAQRRVEIFRQPIGNPMDGRFFRRILRFDEKWIYYRNPDASKYWLSHRQPAKVIVKKINNPKVMLCVWWNFEGVIHWDFVSNGSAVDADVYYQQPERVHEILRRRYTALVNRNRVPLQKDNITRTTMTKIQELREIELLPHPAYSPDLAPSDYNLFRSMAHLLRGRNFENIEAAKVGLTRILRIKNQRLISSRDNKPR